MAKPGDALDRYLAHRFPTTNLTPSPPEPTIPNSSGNPDERKSPTQLAGIDQTPYTAPGPNAPPLDWQAYLTNWGFDQDIVTELDRIFRTYADPNAASASALAYVRGTDWYAKTFPGIQEGEKLGIISNEADYRAYTNKLNDVYHRYAGSAVTADQVSTALKGGYNPTHVEQVFQGKAYVAANGQTVQGVTGAFDDKGAFSAGDLSALGDEQVGLSNSLGPELQRRLALAQQRFQGAFQGVLANPSLSLTPFGRIAAPSLSGGTNLGDVPA